MYSRSLGSLCRCFSFQPLDQSSPATSFPRYPELRALQVPSLVIVGANEPQKTIELSYEWHQQMAGSEFVVLRDTYHAAPRENALVWNQTVRAFLERHGLGGSRPG